MQIVLGAVQRAHHQAIVLCAVINVWHVVIVGDGKIHFLQTAGGQIISHNAHHRVFLASHWIFVVVAAWVERIVLVGVAIALIHRH